MDVKEKVEQIIQILEEKKAVDIVSIQLEDIFVMCDYFIVCSGTSTTHVKALSDELKEKIKNQGTCRMEGRNTARWILHDYGDIVVHIFHPEERQFYNLEKLWADGVLKIR